MAKTKKIAIVFLIGFFFYSLSSLIHLPSSFVYAAVPHLINYQGRLTDASAKPLEGAYDITFRIYDAEAAGSLLWEETHLGAVIQKGVFNVGLGSVTNLNLVFDIPYFLEIKVGTEVMSPRQRITSAGYSVRTEKAENAIQAENANTVGSVGVSATPQANKLLPLDANAKLPLSALKVYDSGWFAITEYTGYTKTHNLGTTKVMTQIYLSSSSDGSANCVGDFTSTYDGGHTEYAGYRGVNVAALTATTVSVRVELLGVASYKIVHDLNGNNITPAYARIVMLALE